MDDDVGQSEVRLERHGDLDNIRWHDSVNGQRAAMGRAGTIASGRERRQEPLTPGEYGTAVHKDARMHPLQNAISRQAVDSGTFPLQSDNAAACDDVLLLGS